jgi:hypothetical protein
MKNKILLLLTISLLALSTTSCKKKDDPLTKTELLTQSEWKFYKVEAYDLNNNFLDETAVTDDIYFNFKPDHDLIIRNVSQANSSVLQWDINGDETKLYLTEDQGNEAEVYIIKKLEEKEFILKEIIVTPKKTKISSYHVYYFKR